MSDTHIGRLENKKMRLNFKKAKIHRKHFYDVLESIKHYKDWMFLNNDLTHIEILKPDISTLHIMKQYGMCFVVKGFMSPSEFSVYDRIRFKHGFYSMMYASRCVGSDIMMQAFNALANDQPMPSHEEVCDAIEDNRLVHIKSDKEEQRIKERIKYKHMSEKYSVILHRKIYRLIKQKRVELLELFV